MKAFWIILFGIIISLNCNGQNNLLKNPLPDLPNSEPKQAGMNPDTINHLLHLIKTTPPNDFRGMVVIKNNRLVLEEYFNTYWRETIHDIRSAGKSVTSLLLGIAIDKGLVKDVEQSIYAALPASKIGTPLTREHAEIKIRHLLTMSSGLHADANDSHAPGNTENWLTKDDWVHFAASLPVIFTPGEKYVYNDVCPMLIGAIIEQASGKKLADFARETLFTPLGIREYYWYTASNGSTGPMGNLYLSTLDFAKIGQLVLNKGRWQEKQVISARWIDEIATKRVDLTGKDPFAAAYGYFWYSASKVVNNKKFDYFYASGNGGNLLLIAPAENLVVSLTSSAYGQGYGHQRSFNIFYYLLSAISEK